MIIAVNARFLLKGKLEGLGYFVRETFAHIVKEHPEHQFYFFFDRPFSEEFIFAANLHPLVIGPPARHPILWKYWFDVSVSRALKKIKADVFVSPDGFLSLTTRVPQCIVVHDLGFLHHPEAYKKSHDAYLRFFTPKFLKKAERIATVSKFTRDDIVQQYGTDASKIDLVYSAVKEGFRPADFDEQERTRIEFTDGKPYFLYAGAIQPRKNLLNLLKAFSIFKRRQKSDMKLVLAGRMAWKNDEFNKLLSTYKYRNDVVLTGYIAEEKLIRLTSAAYALVYPSLFEGFGVPVLEAMKSKVPALTSANSSMSEIGERAALYFDPRDPEDIAEKLILIYKDEKLRAAMMLAGEIVAQQFSWKRTAGLLWESILKTVPR